VYFVHVEKSDLSAALLTRSDYLTFAVQKHFSNFLLSNAMRLDAVDRV